MHDLPIILRVTAAASAPLLISVGSGRVLLGGSLSSAGFLVNPGGGGGSTEIVVVRGCVGRATFVEKSFVVLEDENVEEVGEAVELNCVEVTVDADVVTVAPGGAIAPIPCDVGV